MDKIVTIVSGFHNRGEYVERTMDSLVNQTYSNLNIIVFDDCSNDDTYDKLLQYSSHNNVTILRNAKNLGFVKSLSLILENLETDYIAIQGSGDVSNLERIELQVNILNSSDKIAICGSYVQNIDEKNNVTNLIQRKMQYHHNDLLTGNPLIHGETMFRYDLYKKCGGYDVFYKFAQDRDLWLRMTKFGSIYVLPSILYYRYINETGVSYNLKKMIEQKKFAFVATLRYQKPMDYSKYKIDLFSENWHKKIDFVSLWKIVKKINKMSIVLSIKGYLTIDDVYDINEGLIRRIIKFNFIVFGNSLSKNLYRRIKA